MHTYFEDRRTPIIGMKSNKFTCLLLVGRRLPALP